MELSCVDVEYLQDFRELSGTVLGTDVAHIIPAIGQVSLETCTHDPDKGFTFRVNRTEPSGTGIRSSQDAQNLSRTDRPRVNTRVYK